MKPLKTLDDVARLAGVSPKTVSRVMNSEPNVRAATRKKVLAVAASLGYRPNRAARSLAGRKSFLIAHIYDNPNMDYIARANAGMYASCHRNGYYLLPEPVDVSVSGLAAQVDMFLETSHVDGVVLTPPLSDHAGLLGLLEARNIRSIVISPEKQADTVPSVRMDDRLAAQMMTSHLLELGHSSIGFISGPPQHLAALQREQGYREALCSAGVAVRDCLIRQGDFSYLSGLQAAEALLAAAPAPTAVFAANDAMAAGVIAAILRADLNTPGDISVAGFDDAQIGATLWPPLTTIRQPIREMAEYACDWLIGRTGQSDPAIDHKTFDFELVIRQSTGVAAV